MKTVTFEMRPYRDNEDWRNLSLIVDGSVVNSREINLSNWDYLDSHLRMEMCFDLIPLSLQKELLSNQAEFEDSELYQRWYEYEFYVDGEDAREFIELVPRTRHSTRIQPRCGVECGWEFYKVLKEQGFYKSVAAKLAYWRGYLRGMDMNSVFEKEGTEALTAMGLKCIDKDSEKYGC